jgi:hypothetical protein
MIVLDFTASQPEQFVCLQHVETGQWVGAISGAGSSASTNLQASPHYHALSPLTGEAGTKTVNVPAPLGRVGPYRVFVALTDGGARRNLFAFAWDEKAITKFDFALAAFPTS